MKNNLTYLAHPTIEISLSDNLPQVWTGLQRLPTFDRPTSCLDCGINTYNVHYSQMLKADVRQQVIPESGALVCWACIETRLGREVRVEEVDETALPTIEGYLTNPEMRTLIGTLSRKGYRTLRKVYRRAPNTISFFDIEHTLSADCGYCGAHKSLPYWEIDCSSQDYWALWAHRHDRYALVLYRFFDGGKSALASVLRLADSSPSRGGMPGMDTDKFIACVKSFFAVPIRSRMLVAQEKGELYLVSQKPAWHRVISLHNENNEFRRDDGRIVNWAAVSGNYDPGIRVLGRPTRRTLTKIGQWVYGSDAVEV
jgi:hypothetical protein